MWQILCDFDGTIAVKDVTDTLLNQFALDGWEEIEEEWVSGKIGSRDCMARQVSLLRADRETFNAALDQIEIDPGFPEFVALCEEAGLPLTVVSDGLDYAIKRILDRHGLGYLPIVANHLEMVGEDEYRLSFPYANPDCKKGSGTCKCRTARSLTQGRDMSLLVGDGTSDMCAAGAVDLVFAKHKLLTYCREKGLPVVPYRDFTNATVQLAALLEDVAVAQRVAEPAE